MRLSESWKTQWLATFPGTISPFSMWQLGQQPGTLCSPLNQIIIAPTGIVTVFGLKPEASTVTLKVGGAAEVVGVVVAPAVGTKVIE